MRRNILLVAVMGLAGLPTLAHADPCTAALPSPGTAFWGMVRYVGDGDSCGSLCLAARSCARRAVAPTTASSQLHPERRAIGDLMRRRGFAEGGKGY